MVAAALLCCQQGGKCPHINQGGNQWELLKKAQSPLEEASTGVVPRLRDTTARHKSGQLCWVCSIIRGLRRRGVTGLAPCGGKNARGRNWRTDNVGRREGGPRLLDSALGFVQLLKGRVPGALYRRVLHTQQWPERKTRQAVGSKAIKEWGDPKVNDGAGSCFTPSSKQVRAELD